MGGFHSWMECVLVSVSLTKIHLLTGRDGWENEKVRAVSTTAFPRKYRTASDLSLTHTKTHTHTLDKNTLYKHRRLSLTQNINSRRTNIFFYQTVMGFFTDGFSEKTNTSVTTTDTHTHTHCANTRAAAE